MILFCPFLMNCFHSLALFSHFTEQGFRVRSWETLSASAFKKKKKIKIPRFNKGKQSELIVFSSLMNLKLIAVVYQLARMQHRSSQSLSPLLLYKPFEKA